MAQITPLCDKRIQLEAHEVYNYTENGNLVNTAQAIQHQVLHIEIQYTLSTYCWNP